MTPDTSSISVYVDAREAIQAQRKDIADQSYERQKEMLETVSRGDSMIVSASSFWRQAEGRRVGWDSPGRYGISCRRK